MGWQLKKKEFGQKAQENTERDFQPPPFLEQQISNETVWRKPIYKSDMRKKSKKRACLSRAEILPASTLLRGCPRGYNIELIIFIPYKCNALICKHLIVCKALLLSSYHLVFMKIL